ncbi:hypothetical protein HYS42_00645 [Candidatus Saccharibacteria bacterium]|nr:hypothetical protein [Candidatus Saccharibacteria bacterium]
MTIVLILILIITLGFGSVLLVGAPYLPTMKSTRHDALYLLDLKPGQVFVDLGSGDGRLLVLAAQRGLKAIGYELNPLLWAYSWLRTWRYRRQVEIKLRSFWKADLSEADGVFVFLITRHMDALAKLLAGRKGKKLLKVVSHAFAIPGQKPTKKLGALFLYIYK